MLYIDTSVLVSALTNEADTARSQTWLAEQDASELTISDCTATEFASALSIKLRTGSLGAEHRAAAPRRSRGFPPRAFGSFPWRARIFAAPHATPISRSSTFARATLFILPSAPIMERRSLPLTVAWRKRRPRWASPRCCCPRAKVRPHVRTPSFVSPAARPPLSGSVSGRAVEQQGRRRLVASSADAALEPRADPAERLGRQHRPEPRMADADRALRPPGGLEAQGRRRFVLLDSDAVENGDRRVVPRVPDSVAAIFGAHHILRLRTACIPIETANRITGRPCTREGRGVRGLQSSARDDHEARSRQDQDAHPRNRG